MSLAALLAAKLAELAGKALGAGVEYAARKLGGEPEPASPPLPWSALEHQRKQAAEAVSHKVPCGKAPPGWRCTRNSGHAGPCAAVAALKGGPVDPH